MLLNGSVYSSEPQNPYNFEYKQMGHYWVKEVKTKCPEAYVVNALAETHYKKCISEEDCPWYLHQRDNGKWECSPYKCSLEMEAIVTEGKTCVDKVYDSKKYKVEHYELIAYEE